MPCFKIHLADHCTMPLQSANALTMCKSMKEMLSWCLTHSQNIQHFTQFQKIGATGEWRAKAFTTILTATVHMVKKKISGCIQLLPSFFGRLNSKRTIKDVCSTTFQNRSASDPSYWNTSFKKWTRHLLQKSFKLSNSGHAQRSLLFRWWLQKCAWSADRVAALKLSHGKSQFPL